MPNDCASSVYGLALRMAALSATGAPTAGAALAHVITGFTRLALTPVYFSPAEIEEANAQGGICVSAKPRRSLKRFDAELVVCTIDPSITARIAGGTVLLDAADPIGWSSPQVGEIANPNGTVFEVWSQAIVNGAPAATLPYIRHVLPRAYFERGGTTILNGHEATTFTGEVYPNPNLGNGPFNDIDVDSSKPYFYFRDDVLPAASCAAIAIPAQV